MKKFYITNHAVQRFRERIQPLGVTRTDEQIRKILLDSISNCPSYVNMEGYFINEFEQSKKIPIPVTDSNGPSLEECKVILRKDKKKEDTYAVVSVY